MEQWVEGEGGTFVEIIPLFTPGHRLTFNGGLTTLTMVETDAHLGRRHKGL